MLESCSCDVNCPCRNGEDPDGDECFAIVAYRIDRGLVGEVNVSGLSLILVCQMPGHAEAGNWQVVVLLDECGTQKQRDALLSAFTGKLGGPLADLSAALVDEVKEVQSVPISHEVAGAVGFLRVPGLVEGLRRYGVTRTCEGRSPIQSAWKVEHST